MASMFQNGISQNTKCAIRDGFRRDSHIYEYVCTLLYVCAFALVYVVTGPAKKDQVGTKYTISQNGTYLEYCVQYLLSVNYKILPMKILIDGKNFSYIALGDI